MPSSTNSYGAYNPSATDPYQVENTLAALVGHDNPSEALRLLTKYQIQNQTDRNNYSLAAEQQHEFAKEQLAAQIANNLQKNLIDAGQHGVVGLLQGSGSPFQLDPQVQAQTIADERRTLSGKQVETGLKAAFEGEQSGFSLSPGDVQGLTGLSIAKGVPLSTRNAAIGASGHGGAPGTSSGQLPPDPDLPGVIITDRQGKGESYEQWKTRLKSQGRIPGQVQLPPGADRGRIQPAPVSPQTLPQAKPDTGLKPNSQQPPVQRVPNQSPGATGITQKQVNDYVEQVVRVRNRGQYDDIMRQAAKNGGRIQLIMGPDGTIQGVQGEKGRY